MASDPHAVHCPDCSVEPDVQCRNEDGTLRLHPHATRKQLAAAIENPVLRGRGTEAAKVYRQWFPDVDASQIRCTPTKRQRAWRNRWRRGQGRPEMRDDECLTPELHEPGGPNEGRPVERPEPIALPAASAEPSLSDALAAEKEKEAVKRKRR